MKLLFLFFVLIYFESFAKIDLNQLDSLNKDSIKMVIKMDNKILLKNIEIKSFLFDTSLNYYPTFIKNGYLFFSDSINFKKDLTLFLRIKGRFYVVLINDIIYEYIDSIDIEIEKKKQVFRIFYGYYLKPKYKNSDSWLISYCYTRRQMKKLLKRYQLR